MSRRLYVRVKERNQRPNAVLTLIRQRGKATPEPLPVDGICAHYASRSSCVSRVPYAGHKSRLRDSCDIDFPKCVYDFDNETNYKKTY